MTDQVPGANGPAGAFRCTAEALPRKASVRYERGRGNTRCAAPAHTHTPPPREATGRSAPRVARGTPHRAPQPGGTRLTLRSAKRLPAARRRRPPRACAGSSPQRSRTPRLRYPFPPVPGLEPPDAQLGECRREHQRLFSRIRPIGVDEQLRGVADSFPRRLHPRDITVGLAPNLHLDARNAVSDPAAELSP